MPNLGNGTMAREANPMVKHVVIMAGGTGTRLWPASRSKTPKQFLDLGTGRSLFQEALVRSLALGLEGEVFVVTHESQAPEIHRHTGAHPEGTRRTTILCEPVARNTAAAIAYPMALLEARGDADEPVLVLASDHLIRPVDQFVADVEKASVLAERGKLVVFGIPPTRPETGYGYVEAGEKQKPGLAVRSFHEKPDEPTAARYLAEGRFYWNSGMFAFTPATFLAELREHAPDVARPFDESSGWAEQDPGPARTAAPSAGLREVYDRLPAISVDYAVMERSRSVAMIPAGFQWSDVGSWDEVARLAGDEGNPALAVEAEGNFVHADVPVALAGVKDLLVVVKDGVVLICARGSSQLVRDLVAKAREERQELL
jgi:mannose-1-phosphate guanylyltransferase/mannose-6-phosphate isomerase